MIVENVIISIREYVSNTQNNIRYECTCIYETQQDIHIEILYRLVLDI